MDKLGAQSASAAPMKSMKIEISILAILVQIRQYVHCSVNQGWIIRLQWTTRDGMDKLGAQFASAASNKSMKIEISIY